MSVSWLTTTSGRAAATTSATRPASKTSQTTPSAPAFRTASARSSNRVIAVTSCPAARRRSTSGRPIAPVPPATKTLIAGTLPTELGTLARP
jgi:hypothetical protein